MLRCTILALVGLAMAMPLNASANDSGLRVVVILDNSGSMADRMPGGGTRINAAKDALLRVLDQTPSDAEVGVLLLNPGPQGRWLIPLGPLDKSSLQPAVQSLRANGGTPLGQSMKTASDALLALRDAQRYGTYKLLIVSDGEATDRQLVERYLPEIQARGLLVDVIGVDMAQQHSLATRTSTYRNAADPASLEQAIAEVVLGESSSDTTDDTGQSDFDLISPIPVEVASASLKALTSPLNAPVGESPFEPPSNFTPAPAVAVVDVPAKPAAPGRGGVSFGTLLALGVILFIAFSIFSSIGKSR